MVILALQVVVLVVVVILILLEEIPIGSAILQGALGVSL